MSENPYDDINSYDDVESIGEKPKKEIKCFDCGTILHSEKVIDFSTRTFGVAVCMSCQTKRKDGKTEKDKQVNKQKFRAGPQEYIPKKKLSKEEQIEKTSHKVLLDLAHKNLVSIVTELIKPPTKDDKQVIFKATVTMKDSKIFVAHGDADLDNVGKMIKPHYFRMAETRAVNRALRFATNTGTCSKEELECD